MAETFTWFSKLTDVLELVPDEGARQRLAYAIVMYGSADVEPGLELEWPLNALFEAVREDIDNSRAARVRGRRGGRPRRAERDGAETGDSGGNDEGAAEQGRADDTGIDDAETAAEPPAAAPETTVGNGSTDSEAPAQVGFELVETTGLHAAKTTLQTGFENPKTTGFENTETQTKPNQAKPSQTKPDQARGEGRACAPTPPPKKPKRFVPPSVAEVEAYGLETGYRVDALAFTSWHESKGWKVGSQPMRDWRAAVRTWWLRDHPGERPAPQGAAAKRRSAAEELAAIEEEQARRAALRAERLAAKGGAA